MTIRRARRGDVQAATELALSLWPENHEYDGFSMEIRHLITDNEAAIFLAFDGKKAIGYAQCSLRLDYVEGTKSCPVGYLEGIYVTPDFRAKGIASRLEETCEAWAREKGCSEFASDCALQNTGSQRFHMRCGFTEANRIICFVKKLESIE